MPLMPSRTKHRKMQKGQFAGLSKGAHFVHFGEYGIQVLERGWITNQQIEACRVAINRFFQRRGKVWIRIFPDKPITKKPAEVRMGKGKGRFVRYTYLSKPLKPIFILSQLSTFRVSKFIRYINNFGKYFFLFSQKHRL